MRARTLIVAVTLLCTTAPAHAQVGRRYPSEKREMVDPKTGVVFTALTTDPASDNTIYHTHPMWTYDNKYIVFRSNRGGGGAFAVSEETGEIIQLTQGGNEFNLSRKENKLWCLKGKDVIEVNFDPILKNKAIVENPERFLRKVGSLPQGMGNAGGFGVDADESCAYLGLRLQGGNNPGGIGRMDIKTGEFKVILEVPFQMGHVQCNPFVPGEIVYCHETGGDAPQRMWFVKGDGSGNQALYKETPDEWVTHEIVVEKDHVVFNIMAHQARLRTHPTGIALINIRTQQMKILGYAEGQGYWHSTATEDLKWAAGDNVTGDSMDLISIKTGEKTTLITNLYQGKGIGNKTHSHHRFSPDGTRLLFSSAMLGSADIFTVAIPPVVRGDAKK